MSSTRYGQSVYSLIGHAMEFGTSAGNPIPLQIAPGEMSADAGVKDIDGDSCPDIVLTEQQCGSHCYAFVHVFCLGEELRENARLPGGFFAQLDGEGPPEFVTADTTWRDRFPLAAGAHPAPMVVLRARDGEWQPDLKLQAARTLPSQRLETRARWLWAENYERVTEQVALDMLYGGRAEEAMAYLGQASSCESEDYFERFAKSLAQSEYAAVVRLLNPTLPFSAEELRAQACERQKDR